MKPKNGLVLTQRDINVLNFLFEHRVASHGHIAKRFFPDIAAQLVHRRLSKVAEAGFISKIGVQSGGKLLTVYGLQEAGFKMVAKGYRFEVTLPFFKSDSVLHDVTLVDIKDRFKKMEMVVDYFPENVLQACGDFQENESLKPFVTLNSDAAVTIKTSKGIYNVAIEYEASPKLESRYVKKVTDYYLASQVAGVYYICENRHIENLILRADKEAGAKFEPGIYTSLRENFQNESLQLAFTNRNNAKFIWR